MSKGSEPVRRLERITSEHATPAPSVASLVRRVPTSLVAIVTAVAALYTTDALGVRVPGRDYVRSLFNDPVVFFFTRGAVVVLLAAVMVVGLWFVASVFAHIHHRLWVSRPAGLDSQTLHRGAGDVDAGVEVVYRVVDQTKETNAELMAALERTNRRVKELEEALARRDGDDGPGGQLSLGG